MTGPVAPPLAVLPKNSTEEVRIARSDFRGHDLIDVRVFARFGGPAQVMMPTKKGLSIQVSQLPALIEALQQAQQAIAAVLP